MRQGPSHGVALKGVFGFKGDEEGTLYGQLMQEEILAAGQVVGRAIQLVFALGEDQVVGGVGTAKARITNDTCGDDPTQVGLGQFSLLNYLPAS